MSTPGPATLLAGGSFFESPRWHEGSWWVSDFFRHQVSRVSPTGSETVVMQGEYQPSGLGWLPDGSLVVASMTDRRVLRLAAGEVSVLADLAPYCSGDLNDLVVDAAGHVFVGEVGYDVMTGGEHAPGSLLRVDLDGAVSVVAKGLQVPNGMVISADGGTIVVGETFGNRFTAFDLAPDGSLSARRVWAQLGPEVTGSQTQEMLAQLVLAPDGCTLDAEGRIWVADAAGHRVARVAPGGRIEAEIAAPDGQAIFACALGGDDGRTLLLCCSPDYDEHHRAPVRESVLVTTRVEVPHAGRP